MDGLSLAFNQMAGQSDPNAPRPDTSEHIIISSIALLKMLKHGRAGIPVEVMGLMLGQYVDEYTIYVADVFAMPQSGSGVSVEAVDAVYQQKMVEMLEQVSSTGVVVGWYHSHPGFGCWLSGVDIGTQQMMEKQEPRSVAVVIDPVRSASGQVVIDAFRTIPGMGTGRDSRQVTSNTGHVVPPTLVARTHGLNTMFYSLPISFRKNEHEETMLTNLGRSEWASGLRIYKPDPEQQPNYAPILKQFASKLDEEMRLRMADSKNKASGTGTHKSKEKEIITGRIDPRKALRDAADSSTRTGARTAISLLTAGRVFGAI